MPWIAAITGLGEASILAAISLRPGSRKAPPNSLMSAPAKKVRPSQRFTSARPASSATALKGVGDNVRDKVTMNLSERGRENLLEEIDLLGPVKVKMVEEAQAKIVSVIRSLEDSGQIEVQRGADADELIA